jgi:hypothetical protein
MDFEWEFELEDAKPSLVVSPLDAAFLKSLGHSFEPQKHNILSGHGLAKKAMTMTADQETALILDKLEKLQKYMERYAESHPQVKLTLSKSTQEWNQWLEGLAQKHPGLQLIPGDHESALTLCGMVFVLDVFIPSKIGPI